MSTGEPFFRALIKRVYWRLTWPNLYKRKTGDISQWGRFLADLPDPKDEIQKSNNQFRCRLFLFPQWYSFLANIAGFFALGVETRRISRASAPHQQMAGKTLLLENENPRSVKSIDYLRLIPENLLSQTEPPLILQPSDIGQYLNPFAREILKVCHKEYRFHYYFRYILLRELARMSWILEAYRPVTIMVYAKERNVANALLTAICEHENCSLVSFMHGDYQPNIAMAFMQYSKYYVWHQYFVDMFVRTLRCDPEQFRIYQPTRFLQIINPPDPEASYPYFLTYYFSGEDAIQVQKIHEILCQIEHCGKRYKVRLHPRSPNNDIIIRTFPEGVIEKPTEIDLATSFTMTKYVTALNSTVLLQAYYSGKSIVIDDSSDPDKYASLVQQGTLAMSLEHDLLSSLIEKLETNSNE